MRAGRRHSLQMRTDHGEADGADIQPAILRRLSIGFVNGTGLGAILLAFIAIIFIRSRPFSKARLSDLVREWRGKKPQPPAE